MAVTAAVDPPRTNATGRPRRAPFAVRAVRSWLENTTWTEEAYFALPESNHIVELSDGRLVIPAMPTLRHQRIVGATFRQLQRWNDQAQAGEVLVAPYPIRLWTGKVREPDVLFYLTQHLDRLQEQYGGPPDLVVEVLSPSTRRTDLHEKLTEYAQAGVQEYWTVDPDAQWLEVYRLAAGRLVRTGRYHPGETAASSLLPGFNLDVAALFGAPPAG